MSAQPTVINQPTDPQQLPPNMTRVIETRWQNTFTLEVVTPVGYEELCELVDNAIRAALPELRKELRKEWFKELRKCALTDEASFTAAAQKARGNQS